MQDCGHEWVKRIQSHVVPHAMLRTVKFGPNKIHPLISTITKLRNYCSATMSRVCAETGTTDDNDNEDKDNEILLLFLGFRGRTRISLAP